MSHHPDDVFRDPGCWALVGLGVICGLRPEQLGVGAGPVV